MATTNEVDTALCRPSEEIQSSINTGLNCQPISSKFSQGPDRIFKQIGDKNVKISLFKESSNLRFSMLTTFALTISTLRPNIIPKKRRIPTTLQAQHSLNISTYFYKLFLFHVSSIKTLLLSQVRRPLCQHRFYREPIVSYTR